MSKRKGVSADEKRTRMLEIFHESEDFYQLKELEKLGPKEKGIVAQSVKDVVQSLVDDGLVESERIGPSLYYWSYPDKAEHSLTRLVEKLEKQIQQQKEDMETTVQEIEKEKVDREPSDERTELLKEVSELQAVSDKLKQELKKYEENDPVVWEQRRQRGVEAKIAANRWTDNIFAIKSWVSSKFNLDEAVVNKQFGIPEDLDYVD